MTAQSMACISLILIHVYVDVVTAVFDKFECTANMFLYMELWTEERSFFNFLLIDLSE